MMSSVLARRALAAGARMSSHGRLPVARASQSFHSSPLCREKEETKAEVTQSSLLSDWRVQVPIGFLLAIPLVQNQVYVITEETQLLGCFMVFVASIRSQFGQQISDYFDNKTNSLLAEQNEQEEILINAVRDVIKSHEKKLTLLDEVKSIHDAHFEILKTYSAAKSMEVQHTIRNDLVKMLDYLIQLDESSFNSTQAGMIDTVSEKVTSDFAKDPKMQAAALDEALARLGGKKPSSDVIQGMFRSALKTTAADAQARAKSELKITPELMEVGADAVLAVRKRFGNESTDLSNLPKSITL